ncbi:MAG: aldo/keto reductase, partial [Bryobacteraceae bacterium]
GHSEEVVGQAIRDRSPAPFVFTKCTLVWDAARTVSHNLEAASIRREAEASLRRLGVDVIDLYQMHWPAWKGQPEGVSPGSVEEAVGELTRLREEGKIRHTGVSNFNADQIARANAIAPIVSVQPPYSILNRAIEQSLLPYAAKNNIGVLGYSPMASGLLTGAMTRERIAALDANDWRHRNRNFQEPKLTANLALVEVLRAIGARHERTPGEVAIAWSLHNPAVTAAIVGIRKKDQVDGVIGALEFRLSDAEYEEIEAAAPVG